ncbi:MAG: Rieske 2Fe-2S domain-containing protein [Bdellovibrionota bacterium]
MPRAAQQQTIDEGSPRPYKRFANPSCYVQSWYPLIPCARLQRGSVLSHTALGRRLALFRTNSGVASAVDARCPHLGADLGLGTVEGERLRCAFHGWCISGHGKVEACERSRGGAETHRTYPTAEKFGLLWMFNGRQPLFELPEIPRDQRFRLALPSQRIKCHPHLVLGNGLDLDHFDTLHGFEFTEPPKLSSVDAHRLSVALVGRMQSLPMRILSGCTRASIKATFTTVGASIALVEVSAPTRFTVLFTGRPENGDCVTKTIIFLPSLNPVTVVRNLIILVLLLHSDRKILDRIQFHPNFTPRDALLEKYASLVNALPTG